MAAGGSRALWVVGGMAVAGSAACGSGEVAGGAVGGASTSSGASGGESSVGGASSGGASSGGGGPAVPRNVSTFTPHEGAIRNPERGFYRYVSLLEEETLSWVEDEFSLYFSYVRLDDYRDAPLDDEILDAIEAGIALVRAEHAKLILRFAYNAGPYPDAEPDAPLERVLEHVDALAPLLERNEDAIAVVQAGFIGAWGEWHTSTNGLTSSANKEAVWDALIAAVPTSRSVQLRYPPDLWDLFGEEPLTTELAWTGTPRARTGHHNDCFLAGERDTGTYPEPIEPDVYKEYLAENDLFVPMGGETCAVDPPRSECATALDEIERLRFTFLNHDYHEDVVASWVAGGCYDEIARRLGYRLELEEVDLPERVAPGAPFSVEVRATNVGFAAPINARPVRLLLVAGDDEFVAELPSIEVRSWLPGAELRLVAQVELPASLDVGEVELHLWLPDADADLAADPLQSIRFANDDVWDAARGSNRLGSFAVDGLAPRETLEGASPFVPRP